MAAAENRRTADDGVFDFVIIGAGSAGAVLADRLSADGRHRVAILEAGPRDSNPFIHMPLGYAMTLKSKRYNWQFPTAPDATSGGRVHKWPRGKGLGGSSAINAMIYIRGNPGDYDAWAQLGCSGWGADEVLPYFMRSEDYEHGALPGHGTGGPLPVREPAYVHPLSETLIAACAEYGLPRRHDFNVGAQEGAGLCQFTIRDGRRMSTARTFLARAERRANVRVVTGALVERVLFAGRRATGVAYSRGGKSHHVGAARAVIVAAGAVNSPQILELSGVGDGARLKALGIDVVADLPGVGENLQDHYSVGIGWELKPGTPSINTAARGLGLLRALARYLLHRDGVMAVGPAHVVAFARSDPVLDWPDLQFHATPASLDAEAYQENRLVFHPEPGLSIGVCVLRPQSRGSIHIESPDPRAYPKIAPHYLEAEADALATVKGLEIARAIMAQPAIAPVVLRERLPGPEAADAGALLEFARTSGTTIYHPVGTCAMGPADDRRAVLGPDLGVRGVDGLCVADASVMPRLVSGNTNAPTIMIAEKAADLVLGKAPPPPLRWPAAV